MNKENKKVLEEFIEIWGSYNPHEADVGLEAVIKNFLEEKLKERDTYWEKKIENVLPKKKTKENAINPDALDCIGFNKAIDLIKSNLKE